MTDLERLKTLMAEREEIRARIKGQEQNLSRLQSSYGHDDLIAKTKTDIQDLAFKADELTREIANLHVSLYQAGNPQLIDQ